MGGSTGRVCALSCRAASYCTQNECILQSYCNLCPELSRVASRSLPSKARMITGQNKKRLVDLEASFDLDCTQPPHSTQVSPPTPTRHTPPPTLYFHCLFTPTKIAPYTTHLLKHPSTFSNTRPPLYSGVHHADSRRDVGAGGGRHVTLPQLAPRSGASSPPSSRSKPP